MGQILAFPVPPDRRLDAALRALEAALDEQREALAAFRSEIGELRGAPRPRQEWNN